MHCAGIADCSVALKLQPGNVKLLLRRGSAYVASEHFERAVYDLTAADAALQGMEGQLDMQTAVWHQLR